MLIHFKNIRALKKRMLKVICLMPLMLGGALQAMDTTDLNEQLVQAAIAGTIDQVTELLNKGADINAYSRYAQHFGRTALIEAAAQLRYNVCKLLIEKGADVNAQSKDGTRFTPLMFAALQGNKEICKLLIENGANVYALKIGRETALVCAANSPYSIPEEREKYLDICKLLIDAMIKKPTKEQKDSLVALIGVSKKKRSNELDLVGPHVVKLIGQEAKRQIDLPNAITKAQIMKIQSPWRRQQLLDYFNERIVE